MKNSIKIILTVLIILTMALTATVIGVLASDTDPTLKISAANVSFDSTVHLFYAVSHNNIKNPNNIKLLVWKDEEIGHIDECTVENADCILDVSRKVNENGIVGVAFDYDDLAAAEMTKNVYARAYVEENGVITYSPVVKYSILQYSLNKLGITGSGTSSTTLKYMLEKMLEYGAAAQLHFEPEADRPLATESFVRINANGGTFKDGYKNALVKLGEEVTIYAKPTATLPYVIWNNENGQQVSSYANYTFKAQSNATFTAQLTDKESSFGKYEHVVIIGADGAGAFPTSDTYGTSTPNIDAIFANGSLTRTMRVTSPTSSAASWASMLHGTLPFHNGIYENAPVEAADAVYPINKFPSFLKHIVDLEEDAKVAVYSGWSGITNGILEDENIVNIPQTRDTDVNNVAAVKEYIANNKDFKALFLQLNNPDAAGHNYDYNSEKYYKAIQTADAQIGEIYAALKSAGILDKTLFIVTADHGGTSRLSGGKPDGTGTHGGLSDVEKYVLFGVSGYTVDNNTTGAIDMEIRDTASIVLYALGYPQPATYTSRVPSGVFKDVLATERPVYTDPDNYRDPVPSVTPNFDTTKDTISAVDNKLMVYLPFDGTTNELVNGNNVTEVGKIGYENGYFGDAVVLDDGHLVMDNFDPGTESFTVSMWVKSPAPNGVPPIIASRDRAVGGASTGFLLAMRRYAASTGTSFTLEWSYATNGKNAPDSYSNPYYLPEDFYLGWFHVTCIVDRSAGTITLATDFGEFKVYNSATYLKNDLTLTNELKQLIFGDDLSQNYSSKMGLSIDEFMIFHGVLDREEVNALARYYGKEGVPTIKDYVGTAPTVELGFNGNVNNTGSSNATFDNVNMNYVDSPFGTAADFTSADQNKSTPEYWSNSSNLTLAQQQANGGYNSLTISLWLALNTDMIKYNEDGSAYKSNDYTSANGAAQWMYGDRVLFATHDYSPWNKTTAGAENDGMNAFLYAKPAKVKASELPSYMNIADFTADANGYLMYNSGEFSGEYIYRQKITVRFRLTKDGAMYAQQFSVYMYAALNDWTNIVMVIDRGDYGAGNAKFSIYQDGVKLQLDAVSYYNGSTDEVKPNAADWNDAILDTIADYATLTCGKGFMINDDVGHYPRDMESYLDEFVIFDKALTAEDIQNLLAYYERIAD